MRRPSWTRAALASAAGAATLLRAFARPGDRLWTPVPVAAERLASVPGLPRPGLEAGRLSAPSAGHGLLAWCETQTTAALRAASPEGGAGWSALLAGDEGGEEALDPALPLHDLLWRLPAAAPQIVAAVHHRAFCLEVQKRLGAALPGARMLDSLATLESHLAGGAAGAGSWVVKAPLSAAGRARAIQRHEREPAGLARPELRRRVEKLFARHGPLLFEPWMERLADFGATGLSLPGGVRWLGFHRQSVDARGQFTGVELAAGAADMSAIEELSPEDQESWRRALAGVAGALRRAGYIGPFGIDAWQYREPEGAIRLHPLGEINARMTFGLVARALVQRLSEPLGIRRGSRVRLAFGRRLPAAESSASQLVPLLLAGPEEETAAWLEITKGRLTSDV